MIWPQRARILLPIERDETDYPPTDWEALWARYISDGVYEVENVPFYARDISLGDRIAVITTGNEIVFRSVLSKSSSSTVRVIARSSKLEEIRSVLESLGFEGEVD